jgi:transposase-like protein
LKCHCCNGETQKFGQFKNRNRIVQRYRCVRCNKTFSESQPLGGLRVDFDKACQAVHLLCEGMGIRAISRFTGLDTKTVMCILEEAGQKAVQFLDARIRNVRSDFVQADELISFVKTKQQNTDEDDMEHGNFFTHLSVCRDSKLIINFQVSKRKWEDSLAFMQDLKNRMAGKFTLTTDGLGAYTGRRGVVRKVFGDTIDYATEIKIFSNTRRSGMYVFRALAQPAMVAVTRKARIGNPDLKMATTCHVERTNLSVRLFNRRYTRLTLGYSKTLENLRHSAALFVWHFDFARQHSAHGKTPAMAAGLTDRQWTIQEFLAKTN